MSALALPRRRARRRRRRPKGPGWWFAIAIVLWYAVELCWFLGDLMNGGGALGDIAGATGCVLCLRAAWPVVTSGRYYPFALTPGWCLGLGCFAFGAIAS